MRFQAFVVLASALALAACSDAREVTGTTNACATKLFSPAAFNPKNMEQCVEACIKCDRGVMTTCSTACTLRGAR
jgi:hypothetical protein